jgi:hypothetical protein
MVGAGVRGRRLVVRGAVKGDLLGDEAIVLEDGARVVGDVRAPRVAIATGALVRGFVETGDAGATASKGARTHAAARHVAAPARVAPPPAAKAAPPAAVKAADKPAPAAQSSHAPHAGGTNNAHPPAAQRRPPPPVVPSLKKAKGQVAKKKER